MGRTAFAGIDIWLNAEIVFYSRAKAIFAGVSLAGVGFMADKSGDQSKYGHAVDCHQILSGMIPVPASARHLEQQLHVDAGAS